MRLYPRPSYLSKVAMFRFGDIFWIEQNWTILGRMIKTLFHILGSRIKTLKSGTNLPDSI